ncbi:FecR domain-containing protein [Mucilaginibacter sp. UR6-1]|uniref:FecR family protein n=1 Tax=Mucilaginibacter sp. UR6-1 TaxID=1435643 RepID=UPI001E651D8B|nr:FecR family protein [Mucilaginibacter sp. UR6-1]MCC8408036.1 FecR domain-containing protein [Mucilaginibacter sp. UR6-1]
MTPAELKDLFNRYINGDVTDDEKQLVDDWYASYSDNYAEFNTVGDEQLKTEIYAGIKDSIHKPAAKVRSIKFIRYAAAVTILLVSVTIFTRKKSIPLNLISESRESFTSIKTQTGEVKKISLPDGSSVWLNAKSEIRISDHFQNKQQRYVYLDEGEAFFEVTKNPQRPFLVKTPHVTTRVLGTSFNVRAYTNLKQASVTVRTGKVQVNADKKLLATLTPNMQVKYDPAKAEATVSLADAGAATSWTEGRLVFTKATFNELAFAMANTYGIKLISKNKAATNYRYNIHINTSRTLDETLRIICSVHQNHYRRNNNEVIIY